VSAADAFAVLSDTERARLRPAALPERVEVMKAVLSREPFSDPAWIFERKLDGIRCVAIRDGRRLRLLSRNHLSLNTRFPALAEALSRNTDADFAIDGEIVAFKGTRSGFELLQQRGLRGVAVYFYAFDLLHLSGQDTTALELRSRKRLLRRTLTAGGPVRLSTHHTGDGEALFRDACRRGWEGLVAKRAQAPYTPGRSRDWLKLKCSAEQEFVIGGYTAPRGGRAALGALLLGHNQHGKLRYAGKVGSGFTDASLRELVLQLDPLRQERSPFADEIRERGTTWVAPRLVAQVRFSEWTRDGRLRHPVFLGLRDDKAPEEVVRE
jgi:bifunctional non-homologous end joining protein LigD